MLDAWLVENNRDSFEPDARLSRTILKNNVADFHLTFTFSFPRRGELPRIRARKVQSACEKTKKSERNSRRMVRTWGWKWKTPRRENKTFRRPFRIRADGSGHESERRDVGSEIDGTQDRARRKLGGKRKTRKKGNKTSSSE